eukprot:jgi/Botrbrau1/6598/Bobra.0189s0025.1
MERLAVLLQQIEPGESEVCDVLIIGGGVVGIASAYWLTKSQPELRVVLLENTQWHMLLQAHLEIPACTAACMIGPTTPGCRRPRSNSGSSSRRKAGRK